MSRGVGQLIIILLSALESNQEIILTYTEDFSIMVRLKLLKGYNMVGLIAVLKDAGLKVVTGAALGAGALLGIHLASLVLGTVLSKLV